MKKKIIFTILVILAVFLAIMFIFLKIDFGQNITIEGTTANAKVGAVLITEKYGTVYLDKVITWPEEMIGKRIEIKGSELKNIKYLAEPVVGPDGAISQGGEGTQWVLQDPQW